MAKKTATLQPSPLDVGAAQQAFDQLADELKQLDAAQVQSVHVDLQLTAAIAYSVAARDGADERRSRLALVAQAGIFDIAVLDRLPLMALAAWHTRRKQLEALEVASAARLPEATLKEAQLTRGRMLRVLTHYFEDNAEYGRRISAIRAGTGYLDLANDLLAVADLYEQADISAIVSKDPMHYHADDPAHARQLAQDIFHCLGLTHQGDAASWTDMAQRAWTLMAQNYASLRAAGQLVFRNDEDVDVTYPSLVTATRAHATRANQPSVAPTPNPQPAPPPAQT